MSWQHHSNDPQSPQIQGTVTQPSLPERISSGDGHGGSGVKDGISVLFRGVANFLAPPPSSVSVSSDSPLVSPQTLTGIRNDLAEIGGSFKSSLSVLSSNKAVSGISKFASQFLQFEDQVVGDDQEGGNNGGYCSDGVPGTTDEVVHFVKGISTRPECWTEFPLQFDYADFSMSHPQRVHALTIGELVPEFVTLRLNLCSYMNVEKFWMIYFLLLLPKLNQHDFERLSTAKIVKARDVLLKKLRDKRNLEVEDSEHPRNLNPYQEDREDCVTEKDNIPSEENQILTEITSAAKNLEIDDKMNCEKWSEDADIGTSSSLTSLAKLQEDDVSFSDLEDDGSDLSGRFSGHREEKQDINGSSPDGCSDWVKLNESSERGDGLQNAVHLKGKDSSEDESNDWLTVDDFH